MIPRHRAPASIPESLVPQDVAPTQHLAVDWLFYLVNGMAESFTVLDGVGSVEETADRYVLTTSTDRTYILKFAVAMVRITERTFETAPPVWDPRSQH